MQERMKINDIIVRQPDKGLGYNFETTYTATWLTKEEMSLILRNVGKGKNFKLHYLSPFYGAWRDDTFYVGKGSLAIGRWNEEEERYESLSFNMIGVNPI